MSESAGELIVYRCGCKGIFFFGNEKFSERETEMKDDEMERNGMEDKVAAVLDIRQLVQRCLQLEREVSQHSEACERQAGLLAEARGECERLQVLADIGRAALQRKKNEILMQLRSIVHSTGRIERLRGMEALMADEDVDPGEIEAWHEAITREFQSLYPTRPQSQSPEPDTGVRQVIDLSVYRMTRI
jgi:hypothetical protein